MRMTLVVVALRQRANERRADVGERPRPLRDAISGFDSPVSTVSDRRQELNGKGGVSDPVTSVRWRPTLTFQPRWEAVAATIRIEPRAFLERLPPS